MDSLQQKLDETLQLGSAIEDDHIMRCPDCGGLLVYIAAEIPTLLGSIVVLARALI